MEEEREYDIYYRGSSQELLSLLFPMHSPSSSHFQQMELTKTSYQPKQQSLEMRYSPANVLNTDNIQKEMVYQSRKINNRTNYFYSVLSDDKKSIVWTSVNAFLQMRPSQKTDIVKPVQQKKQSVFQRRFKSYDMVMSVLQSQPKLELQYLSPEAQVNNVKQNMRKVVKGPINRSNWKYTKDQYIRCLSK